jgi:organic radical activating enzyme
LEVSLQQEEQSQNNNIKGCILPWIHIFGTIDGNYKLCCFSEYMKDTKVLGTADQPLLDVWNSPNYKSVRNSFLQGNIPLECKQACYDVEHLGGTSSRQSNNLKYSNYAKLQEYTAVDGSIKTNPIYLDIRFGNLCNFKCRMCGSTASTSWYKESPYNNNKVIDNYTNNVVFWDSLPDIATSIQDVYFAGGEPMVQDGHYKLLEFLINNKLSSNINLSYNTNLSYSKYKKYDLEYLWSKFKKVELWPSVDGYGKRAEYVRSGLDWNKFELNYKKFSKYINTIGAVINIYSITSMPNLILWCKRHNVYLNGTIQIAPEHQAITCLPQDTKNKLTDLYNKFIDKYSYLLDPYEITNIKSWITYMNSKDDTHLLTEFKQFNDGLDLSRNESFTNTFSEYASWYNNI